jgi:hypothetical protein
MTTLIYRTSKSQSIESELDHQITTRGNGKEKGFRRSRSRSHCVEVLVFLMDAARLVMMRANSLSQCGGRAEGLGDDDSTMSAAFSGSGVVGGGPRRKQW